MMTEDKNKPVAKEDQPRSGALHPGGGGEVGTPVTQDYHETPYVPVELGEGEG